MGDLSEHFSRSEFACKCGCGFDDINLKLVNILEQIRFYLNKPLVINSGCRCPEYNKKVGGKQPKNGVGGSPHLRGTAVDIRAVGGKDRFTIVALAMNQGITRIGPAKGFVHIDVDEVNPSPSLWVY